jgi:hypothetical protein
MTNTNVLAIAAPGSRALKNAKYERYCRLRASAQPRIGAYREVGWQSRTDNAAYINACRLERRPEIRDRIAYLTPRRKILLKRNAGGSRSSYGRSAEAISKTFSPPKMISTPQKPPITQQKK